MNRVENYVTGATGFIGSHLMRRLNTSRTVAIPHQRISSFELHPFHKFFYLSSYGNLADQDDWNETIVANVLQPISVILDTLANPDCKFIFVSTSSVNLRVQTAYSRCKRAAEEVLLSLGNKLPMFIARPYSVTGVGEQPSHLIPRLIDSCMGGVQIPFYGEATHDWIDVEDFVSGLLLLSESAKPGIYEFGHGVPITNTEVKETVERITGKKARLLLKQSGRSYDSEKWFCHHHSAKDIGWRPEITLEQSITRMVRARYNKHETNSAAKKMCRTVV